MGWGQGLILQQVGFIFGPFVRKRRIVSHVKQSVIIFVF